jgi:hypothetical protein
VCASIYQGFIVECIYALRVVAGLAVFCGEFAFDVFGVARFSMNAARSVTGFATRVLELRGFLLGPEAAFLAVARGVAFVTLLHFGLFQALFQEAEILE